MVEKGEAGAAVSNFKLNQIGKQKEYADESEKALQKGCGQPGRPALKGGQIPHQCRLRMFIRN